MVSTLERRPTTIPSYSKFALDTLKKCLKWSGFTKQTLVLLSMTCLSRSSWACQWFLSSQSWWSTCISSGNNNHNSHFRWLWSRFVVISGILAKWTKLQLAKELFLQTLLKPGASVISSTWAARVWFASSKFSWATLLWLLSTGRISLVWIDLPT